MPKSKKSKSAADYRGRFAPSPTGYLHLGSLVAALAGWCDARSHQGLWHLRIDDIDPPRDDIQAKSSFAPMLLAHGLEWDGEILFQSQRFDAYRAALTNIDSYPCSCSRKQIAARGQHGPDCHSNQPPFAIRATSHNEVIWRRDDLPSYHLACAMDEIHLNITHVVRGADLDFAQDIQRSLIEQLGYQAPTYRSIPLVYGSSGQKLSKQNLAAPLTLDLVDEQLGAALKHLFPRHSFTGSVTSRLTQAIDAWTECYAA